MAGPGSLLGDALPPHLPPALLQKWPAPSTSYSLGSPKWTELPISDTPIPGACSSDAHQHAALPRELFGALRCSSLTAGVFKHLPQTSGGIWDQHLFLPPTAAGPIPARVSQQEGGTSSQRPDVVVLGCSRGWASAEPPPGIPPMGSGALPGVKFVPAVCQLRAEPVVFWDVSYDVSASRSEGAQARGCFPTSFWDKGLRNQGSFVPPFASNMLVPNLETSAHKLGRVHPMQLHWEHPHR